MSKRFYESFKQPAQVNKYHGKPLIRQNGFLLPAIDSIKGILMTLLCIAIMDLTGIGVLALISKPLREMIFDFTARLFIGN